MRMLQKFGLALLVLCLAIAVCEVLSIAQVSPRPVDSTYLLIVPGQTAGPQSLGDTRDKAISLFPPKPNVDQEFPQKPHSRTEFNWVDIKDYPKFRGNVFMRFRENRFASLSCLKSQSKLFLFANLVAVVPINRWIGSRIVGDFRGRRFVLLALRSLLFLYFLLFDALHFFLAFLECRGHELLLTTECSAPPVTLKVLPL